MEKGVAILPRPLLSRILLGLLVSAPLLGLGFGLGIGTAKALPGGDPNAWQLCDRAIRVQERTYEIPNFLLGAISLVESGTYHEKLKRRVPWPWTVMAEGRGRYFATKAAAINEVRGLRQKGVRNIDVGCMQVNLMHHPKAFRTLEEAFDPRKNAEYAAQFLVSLKDGHNSWSRAVGYYHSRTPVRTNRYREKVMQEWRKVKRYAMRETAEEDKPPLTRPAPVQRRRPLTPKELAKQRREQLAQARQLAALRRERVREVFRQRREAHEAFAERQSKMIETYRRLMADQAHRD